MKDQELSRLRNENKVLLKLLMLTSNYILSIGEETVILPYERDSLLNYIDDELKKNKISNIKK